MNDLEKTNNALEDKILKLKNTETDASPISDGIINIDKYLNAKIKILWILKEAYIQENYDDFGGWSLTKAFDKKQSWEDTDKSNRMANIIHTSYGILNNFTRWNDMDDAKDNPTIFEALKQIAIINLKKIPGGTSSNDTEINKHFIKDKELIYEQINAFNPQIIIGGNTLTHLFADMNIDSKEFQFYGERKVRYYVNENRLYIDAYHPAYRGSSQTYCDDIIGITEQFIISK